MSQEPKSLIKDIEESMKLPRKNGEIIFHNPWESRIFAMAVILSKKGIYSWKAFNSEFVDEIGGHERQHPDVDVASTYYHLWGQAFEKVLLENSLLSQEQLRTRIHEFATGLRHHVC